MTDEFLRLRLYGDDVTPDNARAAGEAFAALLDSVAHSQGLDSAESIGLRVGSLAWMCDGCETEVEAATKPTDWLAAGGLDFCSRCQRERGM